MRRFWTDKELDVLRELYPDNRSIEIAKKLKCSLDRVYNKAYDLGLRKSESFMKSEISGRLTKLTTGGVKFRFHKGHAPANKGKKWEDFMSKEGRNNSIKTTFFKGHLPHNTKSDGEISIRYDEGRAYKYIRISCAKWLPLHVHNWEKVNGPIPKGFIVVFKNKDTMNCDPLNLELITRAENMSRNTVHRYPPELKLAIRKLNQLKREINGKE